MKTDSRFTYAPVPEREGGGVEARCACGWRMRYDNQKRAEEAPRWHRCLPPPPLPDEDEEPTT